MPKILACSFVRATTSRCSHMRITKVAFCVTWVTARHCWCVLRSVSPRPDDSQLRESQRPPRPQRETVPGVNLATRFFKTCNAHASNLCV
jgi:hypothetical protein